MNKIVVVGLEACSGSAFVGLTDLLSVARDAITSSLGNEASFELATVSLDGTPIVDGRGRKLDVGAACGEIAACDAILVPGFEGGDKGEPPAMSRYVAEAAWIRRHHSRGALVCASGAGAFLLAEAGLLDGRRCTTSWRFQDELKRRRPLADVVRGETLIQDRRVVTAGAPLSWVDLALHVVRVLCGVEAARIAVNCAVLDAAPPTQSAYNPANYLTGASPLLMEAERIVRQAGDTPLSAQDLARALSVSERTLHRRLKQACGESPKGFIDRVRIDIARSLLENSVKSVKEVATGAGFADAASFRRTFRRYSGMAPEAYRSWARVRSQHKAYMFAVEKDEIIPEILTRILDSCVNGVTLADPDRPDSPIVYANKEFEKMTGYSHDEIIGQNCRFLQADDREQEGRRRLRDAIANREHIEVTLRNYRKDGTLFHNKLNVTPLFDDQGALIYFLGIQYDVTAQVRAEEEIGELKVKLQSLERRTRA
jgi:PAS domain S-box-containing protein